MFRLSTFSTPVNCFHGCVPVFLFKGQNILFCYTIDRKFWVSHVLFDKDRSLVYNIRGENFSLFRHRTAYAGSSRCFMCTF